jgi:hypothetical protein
LLQQLVLVIKIVHFNDQSINFLDLVNHMKMLLRLDGIEDSFAFLRKLGKLQEWSRAAGLSPIHDEVHQLSLAILVTATTWDGCSRNRALGSDF